MPGPKPLAPHPTGLGRNSLGPWFLVVAVALGTGGCGGCGKEEETRHGAPARPAPAQAAAQPQPKPEEDGKAKKKEPKEKVPLVKPLENPKEKPEEKPSHPEAVSAWTMQDFIEAKAEGDPQLIEAIEYLGNKAPLKDAAAAILVELLKAAPPPEPEAKTEPGTEPKTEPKTRPKSGVFGPGRPPISRGYRRPAAPTGPRTMGSNTQLVPTIIRALAATGTDLAQKTFEEVLRGTFETDDDQAAVDTVLEVLAEHPTPKGEELLFQALTNPAGLRPAAGGDVTLESIQQNTQSLIDASASPEFRVRLANYLVQPTTPNEARARLAPVVMKQHPDNLGAQVVFYASPQVLADAKRGFERDFAAYSVEALEHVLGLPAEGSGPRPGVGPSRPGVRPSRPGVGPSRPGVGPSRPGVGPFQTAPSGPSPGPSPVGPPRKPTGEAEGDPDLPYRLARQLWSPGFIALVQQRLSDSQLLESDPELLRLAVTMPIASMRTRLATTLKDSWEGDPDSLIGSGASVVTDPGFLAVVKTLPREEPEEKTTKAPRPTRPGTRPPTRPPTRPGTPPGTRPGSRPKPSPTEEEPDWYPASEALVQTLCQRFLDAAHAQAEEARRAGQTPDLAAKLAGLPVDLHADAKVALAYHFDWSDAVKQKLEGVDLGRLSIYYVRIEEKDRFARMTGYYRRALQSCRQHDRDDGAWLDRFAVVTEDDSRRSVDVLITRLDPDPDRPATQEEDLIVEILTIDVDRLE